MKLALVLALLVPAFGGDHARGVQLMKEGKFAEAAEAFRAAAAAAPTDAELHYNLALAYWRAGNSGEAEIAAEKAATLSDGKLGALRDGVLGNLKFDAARAKLAGEQPDLSGALEQAHKARDHFVHGATAPGAPAELARNVERALKLIAEIEKKIEEQKQQQEQNKDEKKDDQKQDQKDKPEDGKDGEQGKDQKDPQDKDGKPEDKQEPKPQDGKDQPQQEQPKQDQQDKTEQEQKSEPQQGKDDKGQAKDQPTPPQGEPDPKDRPEPKPEPKPKEEPKADQQPPEQQQPGEAQKSEQPDDKKVEPQVGAGEETKDENQDKPAEQQPALGQPQPGRALTPEETKRLMDLLAQIKQQQAELEKAQKAARPKVKKDW